MNKINYELRITNYELFGIFCYLQRFLLMGIIATGLIFMLFSCGCNQQKGGEEDESINKGKVTVYCDESLINLMDKPFQMYDSVYKDIKLTVNVVNAREAMAKLLSGNAACVIVARDYLRDEDSLMKAFKVEPYERMICAEDGLVFYSNKNFPLDTLTDSQLKDVLLNEKAALKSIYPMLNKEPKFISNNYLSSEFANLSKLVLGKPPIINKLIMFSSLDSVKNYVLKNNNDIGIGYLSQVVKDTNIKCLRISYTDSSGHYVFPHVVHQANILRRYYPYVVPLYVYLLENRRNIPWWFATFLSKEAIVQKYFLNAGIVPAYAKIKLVEEEPSMLEQSTVPLLMPK
jgi:ABC-type phosphate transport system substrate-binding protein